MQRTIFHLLDEPVPTLADPFPSDDPLPGAYELHLPTERDHLAHRYFDTDHAVLRATVDNDLGREPRTAR